jgi:hypothetical protein
MDGQRMAMNLREKTASYYPNARPRAFEVGIEFQDFVCLELAKDNIILQNLGSKLYQIRVGENLQGFEIKYDARCTDTNRLSIEVAEKSRNDPNLPWTPSGIMRDDNSWLYIQGNHDIIFVFAKNHLRRYHDQRRPEIIEFNGTIKRFFLPFHMAEVMAARIIRPIRAGQGERYKA